MITRTSRLAISASLIAVYMQPAGATGTDPVESDSRTNTAVGTDALLSNFNTGSGYQNTAGGYGALQSTTTGYKNAAFGFESLLHNTTGYFNAAVGSGSLVYNTTGNQDTAMGADALYSNTTGSNNTAVGLQSSYANTTGSDNSAIGTLALYTNTSGSANVAVGAAALRYNTTGGNNTSVGESAMLENTTGYDNAALGQGAMIQNTTGALNVASGFNALGRNKDGDYNSAVGGYTLSNLVSGESNIAIGFDAGMSITGSNNIDVGNEGTGLDSGTIRIGTSGIHKEAYVAGIYGVSVKGNAVYVSSTGQLGVVVSSERFKVGIAPMADTAKLEKLRPVTFHLKTDPSGPLQYGLIAEEVAKVYPDLVVRDEKGRIDGVRYDELAPLLLSQMQRDHQRMERDRGELTALREEIAQVRAALVATANASLVAQR